MTLREPGEALWLAKVSPVPPGDVLAFIAKNSDRKVTPEVRNIIEGLQSGRLVIDSKIASILARYAGTTDQFWKNLQVAASKISSEEGAGRIS